MPPWKPPDSFAESITMNDHNTGAEPDRPRKSDDKGEPEKKSGIAIAANGLAKTFTSAFGRKRVHALRGVDIEVRAGEIVGILGPNGAGKTTLLKILLGVVSPTAGTAKIQGQPIGQASARKNLGYLPENHRFPPYLTGRQTLDVYGRLSNLEPNIRKERIPRLIEEAGLSAWIDVRVGKYSKGMMQRLGLAQAVLSDPDIVILDEPTDGVDPVGRREIRDRLRDLKSRGKTILINSHLLSEIELICDRVAILNKGEIVRSGSIEDIVTEGSGARLTLQDFPPDLDLSSFSVQVDSSAVQTEIILESGSAELLNALIDVLRASGCSIMTIEKHRHSLEAGFIHIIEQEENEK